MSIDNISVDVYRSKRDGAWVVHIDTPGLDENAKGPICRIYLNDDTDDPIWNITIDHSRT